MDDFDEYEPKKKTFKKKGSNIRNFFSKQVSDDFDEDDDYARSKEVLFMAFTNDTDKLEGEEGNVDVLLINAIEEKERLRKNIGKLSQEIISLKIEKEEAKRMNEVLNNKLKEKEETCEKLEVEVVSLKRELDKVIKSLKSSQALDIILNTQRPQHDKSRLGYIGETSNLNENTSIHHEEEPRSYDDALHNHPRNEK